MGKKKFISCDRIRYLSLPQYTGLAVKHILEQAQSHEVCAEYLPDADDFSKLPRQWIINITYTLVDSPSPTGPGTSSRFATRSLSKSRSWASILTLKSCSASRSPPPSQVSSQKSLHLCASSPDPQSLVTA